jgi:hypothetical protein
MKPFDTDFVQCVRVTVSPLEQTKTTNSLQFLMGWFISLGLFTISGFQLG